MDGYAAYYGIFKTSGRVRLGKLEAKKRATDGHTYGTAVTWPLFLALPTALQLSLWVCFKFLVLRRNKYCYGISMRRKLQNGRTISLSPRMEQTGDGLISFRMYNCTYILKSRAYFLELS